MAIIKSGATSDNLTIDVTSKAARTTLYKSSGTEVGTSTTPLYVNSSTVATVPGSVGSWATASFRTPGVVATTQVLMTIKNNSGARNIYVRRLAVDVSYTSAAIDIIGAYFRWFVNTGINPTGGTAPTIRALDSSHGSPQAATEVLFASSADGTGTAITHTTPGGSPARQQARGNIMTAVGLAGNIMDYELVSYAQPPTVIRSGETCALILVGSANDVATRHYTVKLLFEEA